MQLFCRSGHDVLQPAEYRRVAIRRFGEAVMMLGKRHSEYRSFVNVVIMSGNRRLEYDCL